MTDGTKLVCRCIKALRLAGLIAPLLCAASFANATDVHPLSPADTSSPRASLQGFIETADDVYRRMAEVLDSYGKSGRLYPSAEEHRKQTKALADAVKLARYFDVSRVAPVLRDTVIGERVVQLKEILDRIDVPAFADIPDRDEMTQHSAKRWRLPYTEIDLTLVENGPRAGEYLVSDETIEHLPEFYERVKHLPYKSGPAAHLNEVYRSISLGGSATIHDAFLSSPAGLSYVIPPRWMLSLPGWAKFRIADVATWQWLGLMVCLLIGGLVIYGSHRATRRRTDDDGNGSRWSLLLVPLVIILVGGLFLPVLSALLRIGGTPRIVIDYVQTGAVYISAAWLAILVSVVVGEAIIASERLTTRSLDSQLIRLGTRLVGMMAAGAILIEGGDELGFPAYSVLAGLGVGGLAVALAARDTIANLIGSLLITIEKPFRVGHVVRVGGTEGTVEDVGFRSTRIRTPDNSLITIPSSAVVNTTVENLSIRKKRRQRFFVQVTYDTTREKVEEIIARITQLIADRPLAEPDTCRVHLNNLAESSLDILVIFHLMVEDYASELKEREAILLQIMDLVREAGVEFAFPTRTLYVENAGAAAATRTTPERLVSAFAGQT